MQRVRQRLAASGWFGWRTAEIIANGMGSFPSPELAMF